MLESSNMSIEDLSIALVWILVQNLSRVQESWGWRLNSFLFYNFVRKSIVFIFGHLHKGTNCKSYASFHFLSSIPSHIHALTMYQVRIIRINCERVPEVPECYCCILLEIFIYKFDITLPLSQMDCFVSSEFKTTSDVTICWATKKCKLGLNTSYK